MAGFLVKIVIEDTHPPVWRRLLIPEKINFADLHEIIQIAFGWKLSCAHDFTFPNRSMRIFCDGDAWGIGRSENDALVDEYIGQCTFIRYSLENEREDSLKIIPEKTDTEYGERFARLIKAKGDDCDAAAVDEKLKKRRLPERESVIQEGTEWDYYGGINNFIQRAAEEKGWNINAVFEMMAAAMNLNKAKEKMPEAPVQVSRIGEMVKEWQGLIEEVVGGSYDTEFHPVRNMTITKKTSDKTSLEMLGKLTGREAMDYCRYLGLEWSDSESKEAQIAKTASFLRENPIYYLWHMDLEGMENFLNICRQADGPVGCNFDTDTICYGIGVGLAEIRVMNHGRRREVEICIARDAAALMKHITRSKVKAETQKLDQVRTDVFPVLQMYGLVDFATLFEKVRDAIGSKMDEKEFRRFLYWHLKMRNEVQTGTCAADQKPYVALKETDMLRAMNLQITDGAFFLYKTCTKEDRKLWKKGFCQVYNGWQWYADYLIHGCRVREETCRRHSMAAFQAVRNGADIKELMGMLLEIYTPRSAYEYKEIWELQMLLLMDTSIYGLKGHSRQEVRELMGKLPKKLSLAPEDGLPEKQIKENSHLYQMSNEIQEQLYFVMDKEYREGERVLEKLLAQTGKRNREMILHVVSYYACNGRFKKAYELTRAALKTCKDADGSLKETLKMLDDMVDTADEFEEDFSDDKVIPFPQQIKTTYRRETKKIGRNDPCPCGSGKKYKQCCGRK